jgi:rhodanese-related sulfurtransferase
MVQTLQRVLALILVGVSLGLISNAIVPKGIPLIAPPKKAPQAEAFIPLEKAQEFWSSGGALFLDARRGEDFEAGHIPNALNLPAEEFEEKYSKFAPLLSPESAIVVYCDGPECELSHRLAADLRGQGYTNVHMLFNGWTSWKKAGLPTETGPSK